MDEQCSEMTFNFWYTLQVLNIYYKKVCYFLFFFGGGGGGGSVALFWGEEYYQAKGRCSYWYKLLYSLATSCLLMCCKE